jgi:hypothetical protein
MLDGHEPTPGASFTVQIPEGTTVLDVMKSVIEMLSERFGIVVVHAEKNQSDGMFTLELTHRG